MAKSNKVQETQENKVDKYKELLGEVKANRLINGEESVTSQTYIPDDSIQQQAYFNSFKDGIFLGTKNEKKSVEELDAANSFERMMNIDSFGKLLTVTDEQKNKNGLYPFYDAENKKWIMKQSALPPSEHNKVHEALFSAYGINAYSDGFVTSLAKGFSNTAKLQQGLENPLGLKSASLGFLEGTVDLGEALVNATQGKGFKSEEGLTDKWNKEQTEKDELYNIPESKLSQQGIGTLEGFGSMLGAGAASIAQTGGAGSLVTMGLKGAVGLGTKLGTIANLANKGKQALTYAQAVNKFATTGNIIRNASQWSAGLLINYGEGYNASKKAGLSDEDAAVFGLATSTVNTYIENALGANVMLDFITGNRNNSKLIAQSILKETGGKATKEALDKATPNILKNSLKTVKEFSDKLRESRVGQALDSGLEEGREEALQTLVNTTGEAFYDNVILNLSPEDHKGKFNTDLLSKDTFIDVFSSSAIGFILGSAGGAMAYRKNKTKSPDLIRIVAEDKEDAIDDILKGNGEYGRFSEQQITAINNDLQKYKKHKVDILQSLGNVKLDTEKLANKIKSSVEMEDDLNSYESNSKKIQDLTTKIDNESNQNTKSSLVSERLKLTNDTEVLKNNLFDKKLKYQQELDIENPELLQDKDRVELNKNIALTEKVIDDINDKSIKETKDEILLNSSIGILKQEQLKLKAITEQAFQKTLSNPVEVKKAKDVLSKLENKLVDLNNIKLNEVEEEVDNTPKPVFEKEKLEKVVDEHFNSLQKLTGKDFTKTLEAYKDELKNKKEFKEIFFDEKNKLHNQVLDKKLKDNINRIKELYRQETIGKEAGVFYQESDNPNSPMYYKDIEGNNFELVQDEKGNVTYKDIEEPSFKKYELSKIVNTNQKGDYDKIIINSSYEPYSFYVTNQGNNNEARKTIIDYLAKDENSNKLKLEYGKQYAKSIESLIKVYQKENKKLNIKDVLKSGLFILREETYNKLDNFVNDTTKKQLEKPIYVKGRNKGNSILGKIEIDGKNYQVSFPVPIFMIDVDGTISKVKFNKDIDDESKVKIISEIYHTVNLENNDLLNKLEIYDRLSDYYQLLDKLEQENVSDVSNLLQKSIIRGYTPSNKKQIDDSIKDTLIYIESNNEELKKQWLEESKKIVEFLPEEDRNKLTSEKWVEKFNHVKDLSHLINSLKKHEGINLHHEKTDLPFELNKQVYDKAKEWGKKYKEIFNNVKSTLNEINLKYENLIVNNKKLAVTYVGKDLTNPVFYNHGKDSLPYNSVNVSDNTYIIYLKSGNGSLPLYITAKKDEDRKSIVTSKNRDELLNNLTFEKLKENFDIDKEVINLTLDLKLKDNLVQKENKAQESKKEEVKPISEISKSTSDIEDKKADIERRRKEELKVWREKYSAFFEKAGKQSTNPEQNKKDIAGLEADYQKYVDDTNDKYDAELASLESQSQQPLIVPNIIQPTEVKNDITDEQLKNLFNQKPIDNELNEEFQLVDNYNINEINYTLKSIDILNSDKGKQIFEKGKKANWDLNKILNELQIPKPQKELILNLNKTNREDIVTDLLANYSYTIEINTAKDVSPFDDILNSSHYSNLTVPGGVNYTENEIATPSIIPSIKGHAQFATDKGIGWFRSDTKKDENLDKKLRELQELHLRYEISYDEYIKKAKELGIDNIENYGEDVSKPTKTRRILEVQSDLFQKGRDKEILSEQFKYADKREEWIKKLEREINQYEEKLKNPVYKVINNNTNKVLTSISQKDKDYYDKNPTGENVRFEIDNTDFLNIIAAKKQEIINLKNREKTDSNKNEFLQLLNKDNNWVTFFVKSIIQDSAKKGYEKVLFPSGNTASKVEGHQTLDQRRENLLNSIKLNEDKIKELENEKYEDRPFSYSKQVYEESKQEGIKDLKNRLIVYKQQLKDLEEGGFAKLKPIYNFYENTVTNIIKKQGYSPKLITDEYGNTWNEITIDNNRDTASILFQKIDKKQLTNQITKESIEDLANKFSEKTGIEVEIIDDSNENFKGKYSNGLATINLAYATLDTPIHEILGHPFISSLKEQNKELYDTLINEIQKEENSYILNKVKRLYTKLNKEKQLEEALVEALSLTASDRLQSTDKSFIKIMKDLLREITKFFKNLLGIKKSIKDLNNNLTIKDVADLILDENFKDLLKNDLNIKYSLIPTAFINVLPNGEPQVIKSYFSRTASTALINEMLIKATSLQRETNVDINKAISQVYDYYVNKFSLDNPFFKTLSGKKRDLFIQYAMTFNPNYGYEETIKEYILNRYKAINRQEFKPDDTDIKDDEDNQNELINNFNSNWENIGNEESLSKKVKNFLQIIETEVDDAFDTDENGNPLKVKTFIDYNDTYNILQRNLAFSNSKLEFMTKIEYLASVNNNIKDFYNRLLVECGIDNLTKLPTKNIDLFNSLYQNFSAYKVDYENINFKFDEKYEFLDSFTSNSNKKEAVNYVLNSFSYSLDKKRQELIDDNKTNDEIIKYYKDNVLLIRKRLAGQNEFNKFDESKIDKYTDEVYKGFIRIGLFLPKTLVKISLIRSYYSMDLLKEPSNVLLAETYRDINAISQDFAGKLDEMLNKKFDNPIVKNVSFLDFKLTNEKGEVTYDYLNSFKDIAENFVVFDESYTSPVIKDANNNSKFSIQKPSFNFKKAYEIKHLFNNLVKNKTNLNNENEILEETDKFTDFYRRHWSFIKDNIYFKNAKLLANIKVSRIQSISNLLRDRVGKDDKEYIDFADFNPDELLLMDLALMQEFNKEIVDGKEKYYNRNYIKILEASNTADIVSMPVNQYVTNQDGKLVINKPLVDTYYNFLNQQYERIQRVKKENELIEKGEFTGDIYYDYHTRGKDSKGKELSKNRGLKLQSGFSNKINSKLESYLDTWNDSETQFKVKTLIKDSLENELNNYKELLKENKLDKYIKKTDEVVKSIDNLFFNNIIQKIYFWQLQHGDFALSFKDNVDIFKRFKISNAVFQNYSDGSNKDKYNVVIQEDPSVWVNKKTMEALFSQEEVDLQENPSEWEKKDRADAQSYDTVKFRVSALSSLGKVNKQGKKLLDKIDKGITLTEQEKWGKDGLFDLDLAMNPKKDIHSSEDFAIKTAITTLTKGLTSYLDKNGVWKPKFEFKGLHNMRVAMENRGIDVLTYPSAAKLSKPNVAKQSDDLNSEVVKINSFYKKDIGMQVNNPSGKEEIVDPTQMINILSLELKNIPEAKPLLDLLDNLNAKIRENAFKEIHDTIKEFSPKVSDYIREKSIQNLETTGADDNTINFFKNLNLNLPNISNKSEQFFFALFKQAFSIKVKGGKFTFVSDDKINVLVDENDNVIDTEDYYPIVKEDKEGNLYSEARDINKSPEILEENINSGKFKLRPLAYNKKLITKDENGLEKEIEYCEVLAPRFSRDLEGIKIGDYIDSDMFMGVGTRIPHQDKHSMSVFKIVGWLPTEYGSTVVVPSQIHYLAGSDFDVDSWFTEFLEFYKKDGKLIKINDNDLQYKELLQNSLAQTESEIAIIEESNKDIFQKIKPINLELLSINKRLEEIDRESIENNEEILKTNFDKRNKTSDDLVFDKEYLKVAYEIKKELEEEYDNLNKRKKELNDIINNEILDKNIINEYNSLLENRSDIENQLSQLEDLENKVLKNQLLQTKIDLYNITPKEIKWTPATQESLEAVTKLTKEDFIKQYKEINNEENNILNKPENIYFNIMSNATWNFDNTEITAYHRNPEVVNINFSDAILKTFKANSNEELKKQVERYLKTYKYINSFKVKENKNIIEEEWNIYQKMFGQNNDSNVYSPLGFYNTFSNIRGGNIGQAASSIAVYTFLNKHSIKLNEQNKVTIINQETGKLVSLEDFSNDLDLIGNRKQDNNSSTLSALTDNAKDLQVSLANFRKNMLSQAMVLLMLGSDMKSTIYFTKALEKGRNSEYFGYDNDKKQLIAINKKLKEINDYLTNLNTALKLTKVLPATIEENNEYINSLKALGLDINDDFELVGTKKVENVPIDDVASYILQDKLMLQNIKNYLEVCKMSKQVFIKNSLVFKEIKSKLAKSQVKLTEKDILNSITPIVLENFKLSNGESKYKINTNLLFTDYDNNLKRQYDKVRDLKDGDNNLIYKDNYFFKFVKFDNDLLKKGIISIDFNSFTNKFPIDTLNKLQDDFRTLLFSQNKEVQQFALAIRTYLYTKDALSFRNNTLIKILDPILFKDLSTGLDNFQENIMNNPIEAEKIAEKIINKNNELKEVEINTPVVKEAYKFFIPYAFTPSEYQEVLLRFDEQYKKPRVEIETPLSYIKVKEEEKVEETKVEKVLPTTSEQINKAQEGNNTKSSPILKLSEKQIDIKATNFNVSGLFNVDKLLLEFKQNPSDKIELDDFKGYIFSINGRVSIDVNDIPFIELNNDFASKVLPNVLKGLDKQQVVKMLEDKGIEPIKNCNNQIIKD